MGWKIWTTAFSAVAFILAPIPIPEAPPPQGGQAEQSYTNAVSSGVGYEEYAEALHLRLDGETVATAPEEYALSLPATISADNGVGKVVLKDWQGYVYALDEASQALYISNSDKSLVGVAEGFYAKTEDGASWPANVELEDGVLILTTDEEKPISFSYEYVDATIPTSALPQGTDRASLVRVPRGYVYNPSLGSLHDYCTNSPDEFPNPFGPNADFRGPCAIHVMCYERKGCASKRCDSALLANMRNNCRVTYAGGATLASCLATARVYYGAVTVVHTFNSCA